MTSLNMSDWTVVVLGLAWLATWPLIWAEFAAMLRLERNQ